MKTSRHLPAIVTAATVLALSVSMTACGSESKPSEPAATASTTAARQIADGSGLIPAIVAKVQPSIVTVFAAGGDGDQGIGSGVVYRSDGTILTNHHVVATATRLEVGFADGSRVAARGIATDPDTDLAVLRVERQGLPAAHFQPALPRAGSLAVVLGSPLGFENSVTAGIVSGLHRQIPGSAAETRALVDLIQTDAAISPGNSGGAVVDADGAVLGISVAYVPPQQGAVAVGFAIPAATATRVADELLQHGRAQHAYLGLQPGELTPQIADDLHVTSDGVVVYAVTPDGPAGRAGLRPGDVVIAVAEQKVTSVEELFAALRTHRPGETVSISYARGGEMRTARVLIADRPS